MIETIFLLMIAHALCDFALQTEPMAQGKNRTRPVDLSKIPPGQKVQSVWPHWLTSHALIHAGGVYVVTQSVTAALVEFVAHWAIDFGKCESWYGIHTDQGLHFATKFAILFFVV